VGNRIVVHAFGVTTYALCINPFRLVHVLMLPLCLNVVHAHPKDTANDLYSHGTKALVWMFYKVDCEFVVMRITLGS